MEANPKPAFRLTINTKLLIVLLALSVVLLAFSAYTAFNNMAILGNYALQKQTDLRDFAVSNGIKSLQTQAEQHLSTVATDQAYISNMFFGDIEAQVNRLADFAEYVWQNQAIFDKTFPFYFSQGTPPENKDAAVGYNLATDVTFEKVKAEVALLSYLNELFLTTQANNPNIFSVYAGTQSGVIYFLPWLADEGPFDPRGRPWYKNAVAAGKLIWTDPYLDSDIKALVMTCAKPFFNPAHELVGVIGMDITLTRLVQGIISTQVGEGGFAFLMKGNGGILASPTISQWDQNAQQGMDSYFKTANLLQSANAELAAAAKAMMQEQPGIAAVSVENQKIYIGHAFVPLTRWSLGVVMPEEKVIAPALEIRDRITAEAQKAEQEINKQRASTRSAMMTIFIVMIFVVIGLTYALSKRITKPILALHDGVQKVGNGNLDYKINVKTGDELEDLAESFNKMTDDLKHYIKDLETTTAAKKKIETELDIARSIQAGLLPQTLPQLPDWEIEAYFCPARQVAGDFYDMFPIDKGKKFFFVVADVCDKGVGPAMFAAIIRTLLRAFSDNYSMSAALESGHLPLVMTNDFTIANQTESNMFATTLAGVFDPETHSVSYINCGHNPPYVIGADYKIRAALKPTGPILGVFPGVQYKVQHVTLEPGETLFVFTDGVPEAHDPQGQLLNDHRLREMLEQPSASAAETLQRVEQGVRAHISTADQFDDITMLLIRRKLEHTS